MSEVTYGRERHIGRPLRRGMWMYDDEINRRMSLNTHEKRMMKKMKMRITTSQAMQMERLSRNGVFAVSHFFQPVAHC